MQPFLEQQQEVPDALIAELLKHYSSADGYDLFPDAKAFFDKLRQVRAQPSIAPWTWEKIVVGVISNSDDRLPSILSSLGLNVQPRTFGSKIEPIAESEDISFIVNSYDVGFEKPEKGIFRAASELGRKLGGMNGYHKLHVGDSISEDCFGALNAQWHAVLVDRAGTFGEREREDGGEAPGETQLIELVKGRGSGKEFMVVRGLDELVDYEDLWRRTGSKRLEQKRKTRHMRP